MKKRVISALLTLVMILSLVPVSAQAETESPAMNFSDVTEGKWFYDSVKYAFEHGYMNGVSDSKFDPSANCTRAMVVTILHRMEGVPKGGSNGFADVPAGKYYTDAVAWAAHNGIVNGVSETQFAPNDNVTREQLAAIIYRYAGHKGAASSKTADLSDYADYDKVHSYAKEALSWANAEGLITGVSETKLDPRGNATRAQIATILTRYDTMIAASASDTVTVTFDLNDGSCDRIEKTVWRGGYIEKPTPDPSREGYVFGGWYRENAGFPFDFSTAITDDIQLVAYWKTPGGQPSAEAEASAARATEASKYSFDQNPLINRGKQMNKTCLPSFDLDDTCFVRDGTRVADLDGKTIAFFTSDNYAAWSYRNEKGETIDEWGWFKQLKDEIGLNVKYTVKQHMNSVNSALQFMNAGKQCDIIYSNHVIFPSSLCISKDITSLININKSGSSPGVCQRTMELAMWGNTYRLIAPVGDVDVLWYNQTLNQELGLSDPHLMWENGKWDWDSFKAWQFSIPKTTKSGEKLTALVQWPESAFIWPSTNGSTLFGVEVADRPGIISNWDNPLTIEAWEFITSVCNSVNYGYERREHLGLFEGTTMMSSTMYTQVYRDTDYSKHIQINWVPYPKSTNDTGVEFCASNGHGMLLPKKTAKEDLVNCALKFAELWATRFTESIFDNLNTFEYYYFNYKQRKQYFDFVTSNVIFALAMNDLSGSGIEQTNFFKCFRGDAAYNVKTEAARASNLVQQYVVECLKYGQ